MTSEPNPQYADRSFRSTGAVVSGVLMLAATAWIGGSALLQGAGRAPLTAGAVLLCAVPLIVAFTLRPVVHAGAERLRVRNPFRTISVPWGAVETVRAGYSTELVADGRTYQLWAIPVSLRARRGAQRHNARLAAGQTLEPLRRRALFGGGQAPQAGVRRSPDDEAVTILRELAEEHADQEGAPTVRWAYEILAPTVVGAATALTLLVTG
ncbi:MULTISPECIES: PH domain-containing protein [Streptomyces]|uniref:PH domain-containing protein n=1 Tax=Streptomyces TaxID=1883 RepID=UPI002248E949|nr:PH domain-containing protein [Streptomyces sp. JHD 1]MCX2969243.1 PH domain-containing protein [Streptomyces sp. JHD 1]